MTIRLSESANGYPIIEVPSPHELVGEFLRALHTTEAAMPLVKIVNEVLTGQSKQAEFLQDDALLKLNHHSGIAQIWLDDHSTSVEKTIEMPLNDFADIVDQWFNYLKLRDSG